MSCHLAMQSWLVQAADLQISEVPHRQAAQGEDRKPPPALDR